MDINETVLVELRRHPNATMDQLMAALGSAHNITKEVLAGVLGYLVANKKVTVSRWTGKNAEGKNAHQYSAV